MCKLRVEDDGWPLKYSITTVTDDNLDITEADFAAMWEGAESLEAVAA